MTTDELGICNGPVAGVVRVGERGFPLSTDGTRKICAGDYFAGDIEPPVQISTNSSWTKVSWQVTGVRQDAYAKTHPLVVEREKPGAERGFDVHPELYGQSAEKQTQWARHPEAMRRMKAAQTPLCGKCLRRKDLCNS